MKQLQHRHTHLPCKQVVSALGLLLGLLMVPLGGCGGGSSSEVEQALETTVDSQQTGSWPRLYVVWTIDCVLKSRQGILDRDLTRSSVETLVGLLERGGYLSTLHVSPQFARAVPQPLTRLARRGHEVALLLPEMERLGVDQPLGALPESVQYRLLARCRDEMLATLGEAPRSIRATNFAGSDEIFRVCTRAGFRQGSITLPGRILPEASAEWLEAHPFVHWASATDRNIPGNLRFLECPLTVDLAQLANRPPGVKDVRQLRIERQGLTAWSSGLMKRYLAAQKRANPPAQCLVIITHNYLEFDNPGSMHYKNLQYLMREIRNVATLYNMRVTPATLDQVGRAASWPPAQ